MSFVSLRMLSLPDDGTDGLDDTIAALQTAGSQLPRALASWVAPVLQGNSMNAGHIVWRMKHASEADAALDMACRIWRDEVRPILETATVAGTGYRMTQADITRTGPGIWRGLLISCFPHAEPSLVQELWDRTPLLARYVPEIRNWALNRAAWCEGLKPIEFVWEQEYDALEGFTGPYMNTPVHWGIVDAYFDAECPEYIVDPQLIQVVAEIDETVM